VKSWATNDITQKLVNNTHIQKNGATSKNLNLTASLNWTLFDGLKIFATRKKVEDFQTLGALQVRGQMINTVAAIVGDYYNIVQQDQQLKSIADQMSISQQRMEIAHEKFTIGSGSKIDYLQAEVDLNAQKAAYLLQQTAIDKSKAVLDQEISLPANQTYQVEDTIPLNLNLVYADLESGVPKNNLGLQLAQENIDISKLSIQEYQADRFPVISLISNYNFSRQQSSAGFSLFSQNKGLTYGFAATIPIFNGLNVKREVEDARLNERYQQLSYSSQQSQVNLALVNAFKDYAYYKQALILEEQNLGVAQENVTVALAAFKQGQTTTVEVKVAQQGLEDAMSRLIAARYNTKLAEVNLLKLDGQLIQ
ncbi:MAG: TolC family protein, partial [Chitinophagaceae bacterium]